MPGAMGNAARRAAEYQMPGAGMGLPPGINFRGPMDPKDFMKQLAGMFGSNMNLLFPRQFPGELPGVKNSATLEDLMKTGGMPDLGPAMQSIKDSSMAMLNEVMAGTRERYGALGLGAGSDIAGAQSRDAATGIAGMNKDMQTLLVDALQKSAQMKLGAAGLDIGNQQFNANMQYGDFLRQEGPTPWMNAFMGMGGGGQGGPGAGSMLGSAAIGATPGILTALMMAGLISDRNLKTDVKPAKPVLDKIDVLDVSNWRYRGSDISHLGPMAQDFKRLFNLGDGKTIMSVDAIGVLFKAVKELSSQLKKLEAQIATAV